MTTQIIESFYDAAWMPERWPQALAGLADRVGGLDAQVLVNDWSSGPRLIGFPRHLSMEGQQSYVARWIADDPRPPLADGMRVGRMFSCHEHCDLDYVRRSPFFQEFLIPDGGRFLTGGRIMEEAGVTAYVGVHRNGRQGPLAEGEVRTLEEMSSHIGRAVRFHVELEQLRTRNAALSAALDFMPKVALVVDGHCRVVAGSRRAETLLAAADALGVRQGQLTAPDGQEDERLHALVRQATSRRQGKRGGALHLHRASNGAALKVEVVPLGASLPACGEWQRDLALLLIDEDAGVRLPSGRRLQDVYGLTAAEARLAVEIAKGMRPDAIALAHGVRISTVRSQLRAVLHKTGTRRQTELVGLLARLPTD